MRLGGLVPLGTKEFLARLIGLAIDRSSLTRARYFRVASYTERNRLTRSNGNLAPKTYGDNCPFEGAAFSFVPIGTKTFWGLEPSPEGLGYCLPSLPGLKPNPIWSLPGLKTEDDMVVAETKNEDDMVLVGTKNRDRLKDYRPNRD